MTQCPYYKEEQQLEHGDVLGPLANNLIPLLVSIATIGSIFVLALWLISRIIPGVESFIKHIVGAESLFHLRYADLPFYAILFLVVVGPGTLALIEYVSSEDRKRESVFFVAMISIVATVILPLIGYILNRQSPALAIVVFAWMLICDFLFYCIHLRC